MYESLKQTESVIGPTAEMKLRDGSGLQGSIQEILEFLWETPKALDSPCFRFQERKRQLFCKAMQIFFLERTPRRLSTVNVPEVAKGVRFNWKEARWNNHKRQNEDQMIMLCVLRVPPTIYWQNKI